MSQSSQPQKVLQRLDRARSWPENVGVLNFDRPAKDVFEAVNRFRPSAENVNVPLAKIWTGKRLLSVDSCEVAAEAFGFPGTIIAVGAGAWLIACEDGGVWLSKFADMSGAEVLVQEALVECKGSLRTPTVRKTLTVEMARFEPYWRNALISGVPALLPELKGASAETDVHAISLDTRLSAEALGAAWLTWVGRLTGETTLGLALATDSELPAVSNLRPLAVKVDGSPASLGARLAEEIDIAQRRPAMSADLLARMGYTKRLGYARDLLSVVLCARGYIPETFSIALVPEERSILLRSDLFDSKGLQSFEDRFNQFVAAFAATPEAPFESLSTDHANSPKFELSFRKAAF